MKIKYLSNHYRNIFMKQIFSSLVLLVFLSSFSFGQNGTRLIGFDARSMGRAGTSIGTFDSPELMMTNPAGISFLNSSMINLDV